MALSEIKIIIQKQETKDEPQTSDSYKIRQIIIKIKEYIYTHEKTQNRPTKIKCTTLTWLTKETKNYNSLLRTKLTEA